jgi:hypothetical protein
MLSLIREDHEDIAVDYHKPLVDVFLDVAALLLRKYQSLIFLSLGETRSLDPTTRIPSWVPYPYKGDFALRQHHKSFKSLQEVLSKITNVAAIQPSILSGGKILQVHGIFLGSVSSICKEVIQLADPPAVAPFRAWNLFLNQAAILRSTSENPTELIKALFRVICTTRDRAAADDIMRSDYPLFSRVIRLISDDQPDSINLMRLWHSRGGQDMKDWIQLKHLLAINLFNACLIAIEDGTIGLAPKRTTPGYQVWMLFRSPMPVVLRQEEGQYRVVGPAFIDFVVQDQIDASMALYKTGDGECWGRELRHIELV